LTGSRDKAKHYALKLLTYRGRSEKELDERLTKKGIAKTVVSSTIDYLRGIGLVDDRALAESLKREALTRKLLGHSGAKRFLINRGIPRGIVETVFTYDENEDVQNARRLVDKKLTSYRNCPRQTARRRLYNLLLRRGYSSETIMKVLKEKTFKEEY
jgi:regulatory protein